MKRVIKIIFLLCSVSVYGQKFYNKTTEWHNIILGGLSKTEYKDSLAQLDFGKLWTETDNHFVYGFIGANYERIRIKIISTSQQNNKSIYYVIGKSMVKNNICTFHGTITVVSIKTYNVQHWGVDDEYRNKGIKKQGLLIADYHFEEDSTQTHSGIFEGIIYTSWYIDRSGNLNYDDIEKYSDIYMNDEFIGIWKEYKTEKKLVCNWADYRIPNCGDLDIGAGEFSPDEKYLKYGWQTYRDAYINHKTQAKQEEEKQWWK